MEIFGVALLVLIAVAWVAAIVFKGTPEMARWSELTAEFAAQRCPGSIFSSLWVNDLRLNGCVGLHVDAGGLYLAPLWPLSWVMKPVLIPLSRLRVTTSMRRGLRKVEIVGTNEMSLHLAEIWAKRIEARQGLMRETT